MQAVYTGTIYSSNDESGAFGFGMGAGALDGQSFTLTYVYDTSIPGIGLYGAPQFNAGYGGSAYSLVDPMVSAELKIGSVSMFATGSDNGEARNYNDGGSAYGFHYAVNSFNDGITYDFANLYAYVYDPLIAVPLGLTDPYVIPAAGTASYGFFNFAHFDYGLGQYTLNAGGYFHMSSLTVSPVSEVPLPATLPLLVSCLGAVGFAAQQRRRKGRLN